MDSDCDLRETTIRSETGDFVIFLAYLTEQLNIVCYTNKMASFYPFYVKGNVFYFGGLGSD